MPSTACDQCYRRKTGCAGERPACNRCTVASLTCTYSTGRPVGKPKGHRKSKSCSATISRSASSYQGSPPLPSVYAAGSHPRSDDAHANYNAGHGNSIASPGSLGSSAAAEPVTPAVGLATLATSGSGIQFNASASSNSQLSLDASSPFDPPILQAGPAEQESAFTLGPNAGWAEPGGVSSWPVQVCPPQTATALMPGRRPGHTELPAFCASMSIDQPWLQAMSSAPHMSGMLIQEDGSRLPCQCSLLLDDIASLFRCQFSLPKANFDQVLQVIQGAVERGHGSLECCDCAVHGWPRVLTNHIVMLQQAIVCCQAILIVVDNDAYSVPDFPASHGIKVEGYHLDSAELKRRVVHAIIEREMDGMQQLANGVRAIILGDYVNGAMPVGVSLLLAALDESFEALRQAVMLPPSA